MICSKCENTASFGISQSLGNDYTITSYYCKQHVSRKKLSTAETKSVKKENPHIFSSEHENEYEEFANEKRMNFKGQ